MGREYESLVQTRRFRLGGGKKKFFFQQRTP